MTCPTSVKIDTNADADVYNGRKHITIFFGMQTDITEGFARGGCLIGSESFGNVPFLN
jgi:hypothetical protein